MEDFKAKMANFYVFVLLVIVYVCFSATHACEQHKTCGDCITDISHCVWCKNDAHNGPRCKGSIINDWCSGYTFDPNNTVNITENLEYSSVKGNIVQIKPQKMDIEMRAGKTKQFDFTFKRVKDYPVDLYFLLDASRTMFKIKDNTVKQSTNIFNVMYNLTSDVHLGLGNFVDKNLLPMTDTINNSNSTYSFINRLRLSEDHEKFTRVLNETDFGKNFDVPEGIFDGLAQVYACQEEIGWRNQTRKIVVVLTDAAPHAAGDSRYAGIIRPYDGKCYTQNGIYTRELEMDYPSLSILNKLASQEEIVTIFSVNDTEHYESFKNVISGIHVAGWSKEDEMKNDDSNIIVETLSSIYNEITNNLKFKVIMDPKYQKHFQVSLKPDCGREECKIHINEEKKIVGTIKLLQYTEDVDIPVNIAVEGIKEQLRLKINVKKICSECGIQKKSAFCSNGGDKVCGVCECDKGRYGSKCECSTTNTLDKDAACMAPKSNKICSGFGNCRCGLCECINGYNGQYCECNTQRCPLGANRGLCSNNGNCSQEICGKCKCEPLWSGDDCGCSVLKTNCIDEDTHKECNGRGECQCNACKCDHLAGWDARIEQDPLCQPISSLQTHSRQCLQTQPCVLGYLENDTSHCNSINISGVANIHDLNETKDWMTCEGVRADVGCNTVFLYMYNKDKYQLDVIVQTELNCAESYYMLGGGCLAGLIAIGIITLAAWKYITDRRDRAEYDRFNKAVQSQGVEWENPTYAPATTSFSNPAYKRSFRK